MNGKPTTYVHKICVTNKTKDKFISVTFNCPRWTDNFEFAASVDSEEEVLVFSEREYVKEFLGY